MVASTGIPGGARLSRRDTAFILFACLVALYLLVAWTPSFVQVEGDDSFTYLAHVHFAEGQPWGTQAHHTSGPWGFVRFQHFYPPTYLLLLGIQSVTAVFAGLVLGLVASRCTRSLWVGVPLIVASLWWFYSSLDARYFFILACVILFMPDFARRATRPSYVLLLALAGFTFHVKGPFMLATLAIAGILAILEIAARRPPLNAGLLMAFILAFGTLAGSTPAMMLAQLRYVVGSAPGYAETFSMLGPFYQLLLFAVFAPAMLLLIARVEWSLRGARGLLRLSAYAMLTWMTYRSSFIRQDDWHVWRSFNTLVPFAACYVLLHREPVCEVLRPIRLSAALGSRRRRRIAGGALAALAALSVLANPEAVSGRFKWLTFPGRGLGELATQGFQWHQQRHRAGLRRIRRNHPIPANVRGPVGAFGQVQTPIVAHGMRNSPLPMIGAYEIWSMDSVERTNAFLRSTRAPRFLVLSYAGLSASNAIALAERYRTLETGALTILERRPVPRPARVETILEARADWNQEISVPAAPRGGVLVVKLDYRRTLLNKLLTAAYQPPRAFLVFSDEDGEIGRIRINHFLAGDGLVAAVSGHRRWGSDGPSLQGLRHPLISDLSEAGDRTPTSLRIEGGDDAKGRWLFPTSAHALYFEPGIDVVLERVRFPESDAREASLHSR